MAATASTSAPSTSAAGEAQASTSAAGTSGSAAPGTAGAPAGDNNTPAQPQPNPLDSLSNIDLRRKLEQSRKDLMQNLAKKKKIDKELSALEQSIYAFEGSYLADTLPGSAGTGGSSSNAPAPFGNIIKGYDAYLKSQSAPAGDRKRGRQAEEVKDVDRMFSRSSWTYSRALELKERDAMSADSDGDDSGAGTRKKHRK